MTQGTLDTMLERENVLLNKICLVLNVDQSKKVKKKDEKLK